MPLFGAHMSVAGGVHKAIESAVSHGCETVQLFTKNSNQWASKPLTPDIVEHFRSVVKEAGLRFTTAHDSYLINLASPDDALYRRSIEAFTDEVQRAERLGLSYLVMHPGAPITSTEEVGLARIVAALDEVHARCPDYRVQVLLETTAGQGTTLGHKFEHLSAILTGVQQPERLGVCFDTCHVFAAGYDIRTEAEYRATMRKFDQVIGLRWLKVFHLNDSLKMFGSRVDRHAGLGLGHIGLDAFRWIVNDQRFRGKPMILETPKENAQGEPMDPINLGILRGLVEEKNF